MACSLSWMHPQQLSSLVDKETLNGCSNNSSPEGGPQQGEQPRGAVGRQNRPLSPSHAKGDGERKPRGWCRSVPVESAPVRSGRPTASPLFIPFTPPTHHPTPRLFVCKASGLGPGGLEGRRGTRRWSSRGSRPALLYCTSPSPLPLG